MDIVINVAKDFTRFPSGRYKKNGTTSGEAFRERFLEENLRIGNRVVVELDGTVGYGSSFLEEAFGGAIRALKMSAENVFRLLEIRSSDAALVEEAKQYITEASAKIQ